jgi:predicted O-methyltransferase YrrM
MLDRKRLISRNLPGLNLDAEIQRSYLNRLDHSNEILDLNLTNKSENNLFFSIDNGSFESGDAEFLYQFIRDVNPQKVIEIGGGQSTKIIQLALRKNSNYFEHYCIEPYEMEWLDNLAGINLIRGKIEDLDFEWSKELKPNDLLFIDSSHIIRPQGDVLFEYLEILPQLSKGVYIHIHDIYTPRDYPENILVSEVRFWNEQYLLEAILSNSNRYEVIASLCVDQEFIYIQLLFSRND